MCVCVCVFDVLLFVCVYVYLMCVFVLIPQYLDEILKYCNYVFTLFFVIETTLKLLAFGLRRFFKER